MRVFLSAAPLVLLLACSRPASPGDHGESADAASAPPQMQNLASIGPAKTRPLSPQGGRRFRVSPLGNDANDCSESKPCREIQRGISLATAPGDVLFVEDGEYARFTVDGLRGEPGRPITIFAIGKRAVVRPDPDCKNKNACRDNIILRRSHHVVLDGISSYGAPRAAVAVFYGTNVAIRNGTYFDNGRWGIFSSFADDLVVENNEVRRSRREHGIYLSNSGDRPVVRANVLRDNDGCGIQINADMRERPEFDKSGKSFYGGVADGLVTGAAIERNLIIGNGAGLLANNKKRKGAGINLDGVQDSIVQGNVLYDNAASGIVAFGDADGSEEDAEEDGDGRFGPKGLSIVHNTVVMPEGARSALQVRLSAGPNVVRNNILYHRDARRAGLELVTEKDAKLVESDGNVLDRVAIGERVRPLEDWRKQLGKDGHSLSLPLARLFVDPARGDYTLLPASPAARAATADPVDEHQDFMGKPRMRREKGHSIGACEVAPAEPQGVRASPVGPRAHQR
ncbi:right-handed parallel beta-helix repeat-containing protein [Polyangium jinanense]|uniref:Right-handed parallel beta-helix repeat-containing protein n=1 Tax=Polyangium jinanense TaxID=2829994 RepID=A0A9X3XB55_9BACT|nr:right-handed parallel beta-helix repeat-containing protein [Polyangium jinanense]MDC3956487.1 right-handed parallel beta-helix repeat-containing protein [Polyangium jinanense]MDC3985518.1 right-handed parallel beta-helix repeat-containing protein [Polyangium jinanense]